MPSTIELSLPSYLSDTQIHIDLEELPSLVVTLPTPAPPKSGMPLSPQAFLLLAALESQFWVPSWDWVCLSLPRSHVYLITIEDKSPRLGLSGQ